MAQKFPVIFQCTQKMNPKLLLVLQNPALSAVPRPTLATLTCFIFHHSLAHFSSFPLDSLIVLKQVKCMSQSLSTSSLSAWKLLFTCFVPSPCRKTHQFDILYTYVYVYSFIFSQQNISFMKKKNFVLFIHNYIRNNAFLL